VAQHNSGELGGFTARYRVDRLVFSGEFARIEDALTAEKRIKRWRRQWKVELIEKANPNWWDQASDLL
jgi:putative endonuclease